ncbi:DUF6098 family protein [Streptomyces sp. NPDC004266]|uniref:DUF6098 family protein n=1 Tax=Streptomyces sp. NPDC004266 TaxID=3364693 RepID=UPI0036B6DCE9
MGRAPLHTWAARRLYDHSPLPRVKDPRLRPWLLRGREAGRGPDSEPLVTEGEPLGWISDRVIEEAASEVERQPNGWGPLDRHA